MGEKKKKKPDEVVEAEFKISMYCQGCEKQIAKIISKIKGVEEFMTDMNNHKVVVKGRMNANKVLKKLKKKTGKKVEMVIKEEESKKKSEEKEGDLQLMKQNPREITDALIIGYCGDNMLYTMFSDENANACSIM
ncbi:heavy metal-associated isoprenylated plant protein 19-like [Solanum verrucosum]|uniref:heavy metal-associated isoprenylated plant protein 19-like n=1 Tax=Solanum verrucosum TaxID=315347 RepID=UPI0020D06E2F|nr:heavy metal-associated isoprenylated plant protein 19-like [Solanum verrucosum]